MNIQKDKWYWVNYGLGPKLARVGAVGPERVVVFLHTHPFDGQPVAVRADDFLAEADAP